MAPVCADPRQIVIALNPARRQALLDLVDEIVACIISQLETPTGDLGSVAPEGDGDGDDSQQQQQQQQQQQRPPPPPGQQQKISSKEARQAERIQKAALMHIKDWRAEFMPKLQEIVKVADSDKIKAERKARRDAMDKKKLDTPEDGENLISFGSIQVERSRDVVSLQALYRPIPTRLASIPLEDRRETLSCLLLLLLSTGRYSAHSRTLVLYLASALELPQTFVNREEAEVARALMESSTADQDHKEAMSAEAEAAKRRQENKFSRLWKVGLASVAGAAVVGVTGGLAAPLVAGAIGGIMGSVGLGGVASFIGIFWMNGALVGALFGAYGAKMTGEMMDSYAKEVDDFRFIPLAEEWGKDYAPPRPPPGQQQEDRQQEDRQQEGRQQGDQQQEDQQLGQRRLRVTIGINGWLASEDDITRPWRVLSGAGSEVFALRYEMKTLLALGSALHDLVHSFAWKAFKAEVIKRTLLATLWAALWPIQVLAAASNVDNPFSRASNRSRKAGRILADALINRVQGERPVTLVGYSLGATAIHACLQSLAERHAFGLVSDVVLIGAPAPSSPAHWRTLRPVVSGRLFNVYSENDMVLGFVYRMHSLALGVAGLQPIPNVEGLENVDLSDRVSGHLRYPELTGEILRRCAFVDVRAATADIERDEDAIRIADERAEGRLVDLDDAAADAGDDGRTDARGDSAGGPTRSGLDDDLRGLTISPPALSPPPPAPPPGLSVRPAAAAAPGQAASKASPPASSAEEAHPPLPALPARPSGLHDDAPSRDARLVRRPVGVPRQKAPQVTPDPTDSEYSDGDKPMAAINMEDSDG